MIGYIAIIKSNQDPINIMNVTESYHNLARNLKILQNHVGGYIQTIPFFSNIEINGNLTECVAFCNEEGKLKDMPYNEFANKLWEDSILRITGKTNNPFNDYLVGDVIIVWGDSEFMKEL